MTISHLLIKTTAAEHSALVNFYTKVLKPLGMTALLTFPTGLTGFGSEAPEYFIGIGEEKTKIHVALSAPDADAVRAFHSAALSAGATDNGAPGFRAHIHANYYAAYILDPSGNNIEAGCMVSSQSN